MPKAKTKRAAILSTGTEILQGLYADTNAQWLSEKLTALGIAVQRHVAAPDRSDDVADALAYLVERYDLVLMTGGLGPTEDDLTRGAVCRVFGAELAEDARAWKMIEEGFALRGGSPPESNRIQCLIPKSARTLYNHWGTAPGFAIEKPRGSMRCRLFAALPGPPRENQPMFEKYLEGILARRFGGGLLTRITTIHTFGVSESALNDSLRPLFEEVADDPNRILAFLAGQARVDVRLTVRAKTRRALSAAERPLLTRIRRLVPGDCIYGGNEDSLESVVSDLLRRRGLHLAVAESCTGGLVAKRITDISGSSDVLLEGWVTYSNHAKQKRLGVRAATLRRCGAVSSETAREMALGALRESGADVAVAITGIAGPTGGTRDKPVGLVWYGLAWRDSIGYENEEREQNSRAGRPRHDTEAGFLRYKARVETFSTCFPSGREMVRLFASHRALDLVRRLLLDLPLDIPPLSVFASAAPSPDHRCAGS